MSRQKPSIFTLLFLSGLLAVYFPASLAAVAALSPPGEVAGSRSRLLILTALLLQPALLLIDHGHFQYNCIGLGLALGAAAAICRGRQLLGSMLFCLSLNHKQMGLYYAPAFFVHLLGCALQQRGFTGKVGRQV